MTPPSLFGLLKRLKCISLLGFLHKTLCAIVAFSLRYFGLLRKAQVFWSLLVIARLEEMVESQTLHETRCRGSMLNTIQ